MNEERVFKFKGVGKTVVTLDGYLISIKRVGALNRINHGKTGDKSIDIRHLSGVHVKPAGSITSGFFQFLYMGSQKKLTDRWTASLDQDCILYFKEEQEMVDAIKEYVDTLLKNFHTPPDVVPFISVASEIRQFKELLDDGALTQEEFDEKKQQLLQAYTPNKLK